MLRSSVDDRLVLMMRRNADAQTKNRSVMQRSLAFALDAEFRPDVEGLRAVAVVAVLLFHAQIKLFSGGFVGVDVFFVLSGFLITRQLLRELAADGTISLPKFWARRARRLLPASCLVLVVTVIAAQWMLTPLRLHDLAIDAIGAGGFVINFVFANRFGNYFGSQLGDSAPSPLQHFWSLAVEEQFYLFWPALMALLTRRPRQYRRLIVVVIVVLGGASFVASAWMTRYYESWAFYMMITRIGELLVGALLAVAAVNFAAADIRLRAVAAWIGVIGILVSVTRYDAGLAFPGTATVLPVFSTALILLGAGAPNSPEMMLSWQPLQWIGRHSYAIYLWHWPVLVLIDAKFGPLNVVQRLLAIAFSVGLSAVSLAVVENPVRHSLQLSSSARRGLQFGGALCATAMLAGACSLLVAPELKTNTVAKELGVLGATTPPTLLQPGNQVGAAVPIVDPNQPTTTTIAPTLLEANQFVLAQGLSATDVPSNLRPSLREVGGDKPKLYDDGCVAEGRDDQLKDCRYGDLNSSITVVLYGDSHAAQWFAPLEQIATAQGLQLVVMTKGGCPTAEVYMPTATLRRTCPIWRDQAVAKIGQLRPAMVIVSAATSYPNPDDEWATGFATTMARLDPLTPRLVVLGDNPASSTKAGPASCLSDHLRNVQACTTSREAAVSEGYKAAEQGVARQIGATFIDTTDWLCTPVACPAIIGDIQIYRDNTHLTTVAAEWFRPLLEAALMPILQGG
jgi:peptidoglycan/LPS O-acetylase OafA/YrhL